jgi:endogenous inhibitor of DNA gyrase (YacG/DUF329 family)
MGMTSRRVELELDEDLAKKLEVIADALGANLVDAVKEAINIVYELVTSETLVVFCPRCKTISSVRAAYDPCADSDGYHITMTCPNCGESVHLDSVPYTG